MVCRHKPGDPDCSSTKSNYENSYGAGSYSPPATPDIERYEILDLNRVGDLIVLKVKYPNCSRCAYEGTKVLVVPSVPELEMLQWKAIDPHFQDPKKQHLRNKRGAPTPVARFPASDEGWLDALNYARSKIKK